MVSCAALPQVLSLSLCVFVSLSIHDRQSSAMASSLSVKQVYLLGYNVAQAAGWGVIAFVLAASTTTFGADAQPMRVLRAVTMLQFAQLMEVAHAAFGTETRVHTRVRRTTTTTHRGSCVCVRVDERDKGVT